MNRRQLSFTVMRIYLLRLASLFQDKPGTCLLYSGEKSDLSKHSFLWLFPYDSFAISSHSSFSHGTNEKKWDLSGEKAWVFLDEHLVMEERWVGYLTYEMGLNADPDRAIRGKKGYLPLAYFQKTKVIIKVDHEADECELFFHSDLNRHEKAWVDSFSKESFWKMLPDPKPASLQIFDVHREGRDAYFKKFAQIRELIRQGEVYQVNLSHEMFIEGLFNPYDIFYRLVQCNPSSFSAYMYFQDFSIVSSSPERLLSKSKDILETRPVKGTAPRSSKSNTDRENREYLLSSEKEKAELLMITDLARNDLGKVSEVATVEVPAMFSLDSYQNVFHMHSKITSKIRKGISPVSSLRAVFPGGSVTGCPKLRAQEVIAELEKRPREIYTGSIGYLWENDFDFNIAIRTLLFYQNILSLQIGGAIVFDSDPEKEFEETLYKGASIFTTLGLKKQKDGDLLFK